MITKTQIVKAMKVATPSFDNDMAWSTRTHSLGGVKFHWTRRVAGFKAEYWRVDWYTGEKFRIWESKQFDDLAAALAHANSVHAEAQAAYLK